MLAKIVHYWLPILRLRDWDVKVRVSMTALDTMGTNEIFYNRRASLITIPPDLWDRWSQSNQAKTGDTLEYACEYIVLHELLHLFGYPYGADLKNLHENCAEEFTKTALRDTMSEYEEGWVECTTRALLNTKRI